MKKHLNSTALVTPGLIRARTIDNMMTYDRRTIDSTGAFLIGELERLDQTLHAPLAAVTWGRDIDLREDVSIADETSSYTNSSFAAAGLNPNGKAWISKDANVITGVSLDIGKTATALTLWGMELKYTIPELQSSEKLGRPIDQQKYEGMQLKHQMDTDEQVYIGDTTLGQYGLVNSTAITATNVGAGASGSTSFVKKSPDEVLNDFNVALNAVWAASGWAVLPKQVRLPPVQFGQLVTAKVSGNADKSILAYIQENNILTQSTGEKLDIQPLNWLVGAGTGGTQGVLGTVDRMVIYTKDKNRVRFPMTLLNRTPLEYRSLFQITTYYGRLGAVEFVYPETLGYFDGI